MRAVILSELSTKKEMLTQVTSRGELGRIAGAMIDSAMSFTEKLFAWMIATYDRQIKLKGQEAGSNTWRYISHVVRSLFWEIHKVCQCGIRCDPPGMIWYSLQAYRLQQEIMEAEFDNHPIVVSVLHEYIQDQIVLKKDLVDVGVDFDGKLNLLEGKFDGLNKRFQVFVTKAGKQKPDNK